MKNDCSLYSAQRGERMTDDRSGGGYWEVLGGLGRDGLGVGSDDDPSNPNNNHEAGPSSGGAPTAGRLL